MKLLAALQQVYDVIGEIDMEEAEGLYKLKETAEAQALAVKKAQEDLAKTLAEHEETRAAFSKEFEKLGQDLGVAKNNHAMEVMRLEGLVHAAREELRSVQVEIGSAREYHNQILNSVESLRRRFG